MSLFNIKSEQYLPIDINTAWSFFSSAKNLAIITPPKMDFKILTNITEKEIYEGMKIDYTLRPILNIKVKWQTEIGRTEKNNYFIDKQLKGPYSIWEHKHTFVSVNGGVMMYDDVKYKLPLGFIGIIAHTLFVRKQLEKIFNYRKHILDKIFSKNANSVH